MATVLTERDSSTGGEQRHQVQAALQPRLVGGYLQELFAGATAHGADSCRVLDMKYEPGQYCTLLYQLGDQLIIGTFRWGEEAAELPPTARLVEPLGMQAYLFQHDPALPGLAVVLDPQRLARALEEALPECRDGAARVLRCRARPLRYRPGRRCTLRIDLWLREARSGARRPRTLYGKVYHDLTKAESACREMELLAGSAPARDGRVIVARVAAFLPELRLVLQEPVEGDSLELLLEGMRGDVTAGDHRGRVGVVRSAAALVAVHTSGLRAGRERPIDAELRRFAKRAAQAAEVDPAVGGPLLELAAALPAWRARMPEWGEEITLVHGDCKHSQCLVTPSGIAILDFDHCGMADPATDIGTYLATLRQLGIWQSLKAGGTAASVSRARWLRGLEDEFLDAYVEAGPRDSGFHLRATWYEAVALMRKALRAFARSPRSPMPLAQVEAARHCLAELPAAHA